ncbi:MAG: FAD-dependent oxidoreductase [Dehalococcoidia bacterium]
MSAKSYDAIVVGAGVGGLGTAAILAAKEGKKVLVLEKESFIGGRVVSFYGKNNQIWINDKPYEYKEFEKAVGSTGTWITHDEPGFQKVVKSGMFNNSLCDGGHGLFWGDKSRISFLCRFLGYPIWMKTNKGYSIVDNKDHSVWHQVEHGKPYQWMADGGKGSRRLLRELATYTFEQIENSKESLGDWLKSRGCEEQSDDWVYIRNLAGSQTAMADPFDMHLRDFAKYQAIAKDIAMDLITGSVATIDAGIGIIDMAVQMSKAITANGGEVWTDAGVEEVVIENKKVKAVKVKTKKGTETIDAPIVICNIAPQAAFKVIPEKNFTDDFVQEVKEKYYVPGLLTGFYQSEKLDWFRIKGIDPRSFTFLNGVCPEKKGLEKLDFVMSSFSWWANVCPAGLNSILFSIPLMREQMHDKNKVNACIAEAEQFLTLNFPTWKKDTPFYFWTAGSEAFGHWRPMGKDRPDNQCPWVEGLYFVGDQYGKKEWGGGVDGAALSAALCADAITGKDYEKQIYPTYHRSSW